MNVFDPLTPTLSLKGEGNEIRSLENRKAEITVPPPPGRGTGGGDPIWAPTTNSSPLQQHPLDPPVGGAFDEAFLPVFTQAAAHQFDDDVVHFQAGVRCIA